MKINKRAFAGVALAGTMMFSLTACFGDDSSPKDATQQKEQQQATNGISQLLSAQPVHSYSYSQLRQNLQELEDAQANGTVTTAFFMHMGMNDPIFSCPAIGAPIASTTELTNPHQTERHGSQYDGGNVVLDQMDPTGVYSGQSTGTYVMCVGQNGQVNPVYWEGSVLTAYGPAHWDKATHNMVIDGPSGSKFSGVKK